MSRTVRIHYRRPPDRAQLFKQRVVHRTTAVVVTFMARTPLHAPVTAGDHTILEPGAPVVWFTFPGEWHDVGRFHRTDGGFTGLYANVLTPARFLDDWSWETTDLFLDVWFPAGGATPVLLDEDEFVAARDAGWLDDDTAARARAEADRLLERAPRGEWPPPVVDEWTLERVRQVEEEGG